MRGFCLFCGSPKKERIYCDKDGQREALPILTYLALPMHYLFFYTLTGVGILLKVVTDGLLKT